MTLHGTVQNGVVVFHGNPAIPDGTEVSVVVAQPADKGASPAAVKRDQGEKMTEEERLRVLAILDRIAALPDENPGDTFSVADHDKVLYGEP